MHSHRWIGQWFLPPPFPALLKPRQGVEVRVEGRVDRHDDDRWPGIHVGRNLGSTRSSQNTCKRVRRKAKCESEAAMLTNDAYIIFICFIFVLVEIFLFYFFIYIILQNEGRASETLLHVLVIDINLSILRKETLILNHLRIYLRGSRPISVTYKLELHGGIKFNGLVLTLNNSLSWRKFWSQHKLEGYVICI